MRLIVLDATTKSIEIVLDDYLAVDEVDFTAHYADVTSSGFTEGSNDGVSNGDTPATVVAAPAASTRRVVREITLYNDSNHTIGVRLQFNNNSTIRIIDDIELTAGEAWAFSEQPISAAGTGDMLASVYDPQTIEDDAFDTDNHTDGVTNGVYTLAERSKLSGIETGATADQSDGEIETAYNNQVSVVSQAEAEAGVATTVRRWTAQRVGQAIAALGGSGGLTYNTETVTTGDVTAVEGQIDDCTIGGMTANRNWDLPTPSAAGIICAVRVLDGDDTYALILRANSTEITRLFIAGESMVFRSTGTGAGDWEVAEGGDGRIPSKCRIEDNDAQAIANNTATTLNLDEKAFDVGDLADTANDRINIRRTNKYTIMGGFRFGTMSAAATRVICSILDDTDAVLVTAEIYGANGAAPGNSLSVIASLTVGDYVDMVIYQNSGASQNTNGTSPSHLQLAELLE